MRKFFLSNLFLYFFFPLLIGNFLIFIGYSGYFLNLFSTYQQDIPNRALPDLTVYTNYDPFSSLNQTETDSLFIEYKIEQIVVLGWANLKVNISNNLINATVIFADRFNNNNIVFALNNSSCVADLQDVNTHVGDSINLTISFMDYAINKNLKVLGNNSFKDYLYPKLGNFFSQIMNIERNVILLNRLTFYQWLNDLNVTYTNLNPRFFVNIIFSTEYLLEMYPLAAYKFAQNNEQKLRNIIDNGFRETKSRFLYTLLEFSTLSAYIRKIVTDSQDVLFQLMIIIIASLIVYSLLIKHFAMQYYKKNDKVLKLLQEKGLSPHRLLFFQIITCSLYIFLSAILTTFISALFLEIFTGKVILDFNNIFIFNLGLSLIFGFFQLNIVINHINSQFFSQRKSSSSQKDQKKIKRIIVQLFIQLSIAFVIYLTFNLFINANFNPSRSVFYKYNVFYSYLPGIIIALNFLILNNELVKYVILFPFQVLDYFSSLAGIILQYVRLLFFKLSRYLHLIFIFYFVCFTFAIIIDTNENYISSNYQANLPDKLTIYYSPEDQDIYTHNIKPYISSSINVNVYLAQLTAGHHIFSTLVFALDSSNITSFFSENNLISNYKGEISPAEVSNYLTQSVHFATVSKNIVNHFPSKKEFGSSISIDFLSPNKTIFVPDVIYYAGYTLFCPIFSYFSHYYVSQYSANRDSFIISNQDKFKSIENLEPIVAMNILSVSQSNKETLYSKIQEVNMRYSTDIEILQTTENSFLENSSFNSKSMLPVVNTLFAYVDLITLILITLMIAETFTYSRPLLFLFTSRGVDTRKSLAVFFLSQIIVIILFALFTLLMSYVMLVVIVATYLANPYYLAIKATIGYNTLTVSLLLLIPIILILLVFLIGHYIRIRSQGILELSRGVVDKWA